MSLFGRLTMPVRFTLAVLAALTLTGCAASLAAGAIGAAARSAQGDPDAYHNNETLKLAAAQACRARAATHGEVQVIDLEQRSARRVVVWGTATSTAQRQSFECTYAGRVTAFRLRRL
jgi:type IV pilus biogenesis protein CpaD/CtpE